MSEDKRPSPAPDASSPNDRGTGVQTLPAEVEPPPSTITTGGGDYVIHALRPLAIFAVVAVLAGRALAPALAGAGVGLGWLVLPVGRFGAIISQVFAFTAMMLTLLTVVVVARSRLPLAARLGAITLGGFAVLPTVWAVQHPVPELSAALVGGSAATLSLLASPTALRAPFARAAGLVIALVAVAGLLRLGAVGLAIKAAAQGGARLAPYARAVATAAFLADVLAIASAIGWIGSRGKRLTSPASIAVLGIALVCTRQAMSGRAEGIHPLDIVLWQSAQRLATRPEPALPVAFQIFIAFLGPLVALWAIFARGAVAPIGAAIALALCAHGALEMPPSALMLMMAALGLALTAHGGRGLWAMIGGSR